MYIQDMAVASEKVVIEKDTYQNFLHFLVQF